MFQASISGVVNDETVTENIGDPVESCRVAWTELENKLTAEYDAIMADDSFVGSARLDKMDENDVPYDAVMDITHEQPGEVTAGGRTFKVESIDTEPGEFTVFESSEPEGFLPPA